MDEAVVLARESNDRLAEAVRRYPERLAGFAALPDPGAGGCRRGVGAGGTGVGFVGAIINGHAGGRS